MADEFNGVEVGTAYVTVLPSTKGFHKKLASDVEGASAQAGQAGGKAAGSGFALGFGKALPAIAGTLGGVFAVGKVKEFAAEAIGAASDLAESRSKVDVVFGQSARAIEQWSQTSATSVLLSKQAALESIGTFGNLFTAMDISQQKAAAMSKDAVQLSADLASFNNREVADVLLAVRSGLVGETEPLRALGINISQARIEQEAFNSKLWDGKGAIDAAAKAQAAFTLMQRDAKNAIGDVARTADGYANTLRAIGAAADNAKAKIGGGLLQGIESVSQAMGGPSGIVRLVDQWSEGVANKLAGIGAFTADIANLVGGAGEEDAGPIIPQRRPGWGFGNGSLMDDPAWLTGNPAAMYWAVMDWRGGNARADQYSLEQAQAEAERAKYMRDALSGSLNKSMFDRDDQSAAKAYLDGLRSIADGAVHAATGISTLQAALDEFDTKAKSRQAGIGVRDQWRALGDMGETSSKQVKVRNPKWRPGSSVPEFITKTQTTNTPFDPDVIGGRFALTASGDEGRDWATILGQRVTDKAQEFSDPARAQAYIQRWAKRLGGQFAEWDIKNPYAYARSFLPDAGAYDEILAARSANLGTLETRGAMRDSDARGSTFNIRIDKVEVPGDGAFRSLKAQAEALAASTPGGSLSMADRLDR